MKGLCFFLLTQRYTVDLGLKSGCLECCIVCYGRHDMIRRIFEPQMRERKSFSGDQSSNMLCPSITELIIIRNESDKWSVQTHVSLYILCSLAPDTIVRDTTPPSKMLSETFIYIILTLRTLSRFFCCQQVLWKFDSYPQHQWSCHWYF